MPDFLKFYLTAMMVAFLSFQPLRGREMLSINGLLSKCRLRSTQRYKFNFYMKQFLFHNLMWIHFKYLIIKWVDGFY